MGHRRRPLARRWPGGPVVARFELEPAPIAGRGSRRGNVASYATTSPSPNAIEPVLPHPAPLRDPARGDRHELGRVPAARRAGRRQERRVGLDQQPLAGHEPHDLRRRLLAAPEHQPGERHGEAHGDHLAGVVHGPAERVDHGRRPALERRGVPAPRRSPPRAAPRPARPARRARRPASGSGGSPACPWRAPARGSARRLSSWPSHGENIRSESSPVSPIATTRSSRAHASIVDPLAGGHLRGIVRVDADGRVEERATSDELERPLGGARVPARHQDPLEARQPGAADHQVDVVVEPVGVEVSVGVDEAHDPMVRAGSTAGRGASAAGQAGCASWPCHSPTSLPSVSRTTAKRPMPPPMSVGGSTSAPPLATAATMASSSESTLM